MNAIKQKIGQVIKKYAIIFKQRSKLYLIVSVSIIIICTFLFIYEYREEKNKQLKVIETCFSNCLDKELESHFSSFEHMSFYRKKQKKHPSTINIQTKDGKQTILLDTIRNKHNIAKDPHIRALQSIVLKRYPEFVDSLYFRWNKELKDVGIEANITLLYSLNKEHSPQIIGDSTLISPLDSLFTYYVGYTNEHIFTVYGSMPFFIFKRSYLIIIPILLLLILLFSYIKRKKSAELMETETELPEVTSMKEIAQDTIYEVIGVCYFNITQQIIYKDSVHMDIVELNNPETLLLEILLTKENNQASKDDLMNGSWPEICVSDVTLRSAISMLRKKLKKVDSRLTIVSKLDVYRLLIK